MAGPRRMTRGGHIGGFGALVARLMTVLGDLNINDDVTIADLVQAGRATITGLLTLNGPFKAPPTAATSSGGSIAWDAATARTRSHTLTENTTLANPSNLAAGMSGVWYITQHASAAKTLAFGNQFAPSTAGVPAAIDMGVGKTAILAWEAVTDTKILYSWLGEA